MMERVRCPRCDRSLGSRHALELHLYYVHRLRGSSAYGLAQRAPVLEVSE